ncbi:FtsW/RodA/SpoVE family cell cycle protein [Candidatus Gracilibacteria bacterium]|nr:FtsW/RodA/SpoVE family cell cycle protein [Candidatus Gracilibacteria bacterium]
MPIIIIGIILIGFGILAIYSVSIYESFALTLSLIEKGIMSGEASNYFYFFRQLRNIGIAIIMSLLVYRVPIKFFQNNRNITILVVIIFLLQLAVFIPGIGIVLNGARGWIDIPGLPSIQPSEFFKLGYVLFLGNWLLRKKNFINKNEFILSFVILNAILFFVFFLIPDLGTVLVLGITGLIMAWYAGLKFKKVLLIFFGGMILGASVGGIAGMVSDRFAYIQKRVTYFISSDVDPQNRQIGWQNEQALMAIGGGGILGKGYGKGLQKFGFIPEAQSDFIFAAYSEEIGFVGNLMLLALYFYLMFYFLKNLSYAKDDYPKLLGVGIISLIIVQVFINIGVNTKILPNTGLTLPFISYGGTALMVNFIEIIFLYKIIKRK